MGLNPETKGELAGWLALVSVPGLGSAGQRALLKRFGPPQVILAQSRADLASVVGERSAEALLVATQATIVATVLDWLSAGADRHVLTLTDPAYPAALLEAPEPPSVLYARGSLQLLGTPCIAVVGSRNASAGGVRNAEQFSRALAEAGQTVVSGLALGIDAAAHQGALEAGGRTIAVLGTGIDRIYPARNAELARRIVEGDQGLILSELPLGSGPLAHHFPRRNRIIAGLSRGVLVVEAATESGSLITARLAAESGREVFAIPGSIHSPQSRGCHQLIRQGAKLVESISDILEEFGPAVVRANPPLALEDRSGVLDFLGHDPVTIDEVVERSGLTTDAVLAILFELELGGQVASLPGGRYQRLQ